MANMNGLCDIEGCQGLPLLGWRPLTERIGRKICEQHWHKHKNKQDSFDLYEVFGFRRSVGFPKPAEKKDVPRFRRRTDTICCRQCGGERKPGHTYCSKCSQSRQRQANQQRQRRHRMKHRLDRAVA